MYTDLTSCRSLIGFILLASNDQLTASSQADTFHGTDRSRLNTQDLSSYAGAWVSGIQAVGQYIQADFRVVRHVERVATQGRSTYEQRVTSYRFAYSIDGTNYAFVANDDGSEKTFDGNYDGDTLVQHDFDPAFAARYVRLYPQTWNGRMSLRWEVYGCEIGKLTQKHNVCILNHILVDAVVQYNVTN